MGPRGSPGRGPRDSPGATGEPCQGVPWGPSGPGPRWHGGGTLDMCQRLGPRSSHPNGQRLGVDNRDTRLHYVAASYIGVLYIFGLPGVVDPSRCCTRAVMPLVDPRLFSLASSDNAFGISRCIRNVLLQSRSGNGWITCVHVLEPPAGDIPSSQSIGSMEGSPRPVLPRRRGFGNRRPRLTSRSGSVFWAAACSIWLPARPDTRLMVPAHRQGCGPVVYPPELATCHAPARPNFQSPILLRRALRTRL